MDNNNVMNCYGELNNCTLFKNKQECIETEKNIIGEDINNQDLLNDRNEFIKNNLLEKNKLVEYEVLDNSHPGYLGDEFIDNYPIVNNINCIPNYRDDSRCKHLNENRIDDIITLSDGNLIDDYEEIINKTQILEFFNKKDYNFK